MINFFNKFVYTEESLALNLSKQLKKKPEKYFYVLCLKILREFYRFFQRFITYPSLREFFKSCEKFFFKKLYVKKNLLAEGIKNNSYCEISNIFSSKQIKEIKEFTKKKNLIGIYTGEKKFNLKSVPTNTSMGYLNTEDLLNCPHIIEGANNNKLNDILKAYFQRTYKLDWIWCWWSFPQKNSVGPQIFHRDYENLNFVKVFVYLTDTDLKNGAHELIKSSHKSNHFYSKTRYAEKDIYKKFKKSDLVKIKGKAGKTFIENTFAIHRGNAPIKKKRLILCYMFSIIPSSRSPKLPFFNSNIKKFSKDIKKNKYLNSLFIDQ